VDGGDVNIDPGKTPTAPTMPSVQEFMRMNDIPYHQTAIYDLRERYKPKLVRCLGYVYAQSPRNTSELVQLMNKYNIAPSFQSAVLSQVKVDQNGGVFSSP
jgi:hypothetical protein